jgi:hypothetical protein
MQDNYTTNKIGRNSKMIIENFKAGLTEKELNIILNKYFINDLPVSNLVLTYDEDLIKLTGIAKKVVTVPFNAWIKISAKGSAKIGLKITKIEAAGPVGNMLRGLIWNLLLRMLPTNEGVESSGYRLRINLNKLLLYWDIKAHLNLESIDIDKGLLKVNLSGNIEPPGYLKKYMKPSSVKAEYNV